MQNEQDPTDWDRRYREEQTPWDKSEPAPPLLEYLESASMPVSGRVLVPGCGIGHDVRALAAVSATAEVIGLDISETAINRATGYKTVGAERFIQADLFDLPEEFKGTFDYVFEHTCLSGLPREFRPQYADAFHTALKPGGKILAIFFLTPWDDGETPNPPPHAVTLEELDELFSDRFELLKEWEPTRHYPGREGRELMRLLQKR